jgi:hypothetical protein
MKERNLDEIARQRDIMAKDHDELLSVKKSEFDNLKRAFDEQHYENENLRRTINQKQEEISNLEHLNN